MCPGDRAGKRASRARRFASVLQVVNTWCACKRFHPNHLGLTLFTEVEDEACPFSTAGQPPSTLMDASGRYLCGRYSPLRQALQCLPGPAPYSLP